MMDPIRWALLLVLSACTIEDSLVECGDVKCPIGATCISPGVSQRVAGTCPAIVWR